MKKAFFKPIDAHTWRMRDVVSIFILSTVAIMVLAIGAGVIFGVATGISGLLGYQLSIEKISWESMMAFFMVLLQDGALFFFLWVFVIRKDKQFWKKIHWNWLGLKKTLKWVLGTYLLLTIALALFLNIGTELYQRYIGIDTAEIREEYEEHKDLIGEETYKELENLEVLPGFGEQQSIIDVFGNDLTGIILGFLLVVLIGPAFEEFFFRGYLLQVCLKKIPSIVGFILSAFIFAVYHFEFSVLLPLFALGLLFNWVYMKTRSLATTTILHMLVNIIAFTLQLQGVV